MRTHFKLYRILLRETTRQVWLVEHVADLVLRRKESVLRAGRDHYVEWLVHLRHQRLLLRYILENGRQFLQQKASCASPPQSPFDRGH